MNTESLKKTITETIYYIKYILSLLYIAKNKKRVMKKIDNGDILNVLFVVQYIPGWNKLEPIYLKMLKDKRFNPIIVCVPMNIQKNIVMNKNKNDTYHYFIEHGFNALNAINDDGGWLDLNQLKPDYMFHSRPYNHFMPKCYSSEKIVKYTLICNVLYGACLAKNDREVCINKEYFKYVYTYYSFDESEKDYFNNKYKIGIKCGIQRCFPFGATGLEQLLGSKNNIVSDTNFKKTILWTPRWSTDKYVGGSNFFNYKDTILQLANNNLDILFIIRPHPLMFTNFLKTGEMTEKEVTEFKLYCNNCSNVVLDESKSYSDTFLNSDLLITDFSGIVPEYFITGKPIIYCHSNVNFEYTDTINQMIHSCYESFDSNDIERYVQKLINQEDVKLQERTDCLNSLFSNVIHNSTNILESLVTVNNHLMHYYP